MIQNMVKSLGSVTSFKAKKDRTTQHTTQQKNKTPKTLSSRGIFAEKEAPSDLSIIVLYLYANSGQTLIFIENCP